MARSTQQDGKPEGTPDGFADDWLDPTDQHAVAAYIEAYGIEAFQAKRLKDTGTTYGN